MLQALAFYEKIKPFFDSFRLKMVIDRAGYRLNVGIILVNQSGRVFWGRRQGHDAWQFPQGGLVHGETSLQAMYRELREEIGLEKEDIEF